MSMQSVYWLFKGAGYSSNDPEHSVAQWHVDSGSFDWKMFPGFGNQARPVPIFKLIIILYI